MTTPEARAHQNIDAQLAACGCLVQDRAAMNLYAGRGVAVREFPLETGFADYLLFVERRMSVVQELERAVSVSLKRAERLRQAILKRAFEGRLVAQNPEDEPVRAKHPPG